MTIIGYARVSTDGQSLQLQTQALHAAGCARIFAEKISGAYSDRPQLAKALAALTAGDCLVVCKLDRLARSTRDLLNTLDAIGKAGATFRSLADAWAEFERHLILTRTAEGFDPDSSTSFTSSLPGIAVRRTASLRSPMPAIHGSVTSAWTPGLSPAVTNGV
jgi:hypothetical protein